MRVNRTRVRQGEWKEGNVGRRIALMYALVLALLFSTLGAAVAAPKTGCPAGDWAESTVEAAAATIWPALLDPSPWPDEAAFAATIAGFDRNNDGSVCTKTIWGEDLNPNSKWYQLGVELIGSPTQMFIVRDNNSNGSNN